MASVAVLEKAIIAYVDNHHEGVTMDDIECNVKIRCQSIGISRLTASLIFHQGICMINEFGEVYNPNHYQNRGVFKYYPNNLRYKAKEVPFNPNFKKEVTN